jgi:hypothetical protein
MIISEFLVWKHYLKNRYNIHMEIQHVQEDIWDIQKGKKDGSGK